MGDPISCLLATAVVALAEAVAAADPPDEPPLGRFDFGRVEMAVPIKIVLCAPDESAAEKAAWAVLLPSSGPLSP